jgi:two-component system, OmpR family, sensor kinase
MRSILRTLPIRWQITILHATILALVLAGGGLALWNAQRTFQYDGMIARQLADLRTHIPPQPELKLGVGALPSQKVDPNLLKEHYAAITTALVPPGEDPAATRDKLALLDPELADQVFPPGAPLPAPDEMKKIVSKLVFELFPPGEDPKDTRKKLMSLGANLDPTLPATPTPSQSAFQKYLSSLVRQISAKDRGVAVFALDRSVLIQSSYGPICAASPYTSKVAFGADAGDTVLRQLKLAQYIAWFEPGQLSVLLPVVGQQDQLLALAQICVPTDSIEASLSQLAISLAVGWVLVVGLSAALGVTATRRVLRPLDRVVATTGRIAAGDLGQRVGLPPGQTEIAKLGAAFDAMVARLEQAFAAQRRFVADAAHELRTPLTALSASVELLLMGAAENDRATSQRLLRHLDSELSRVIRLTNDLLTLSRLDTRPQIALRPTELACLLGEVAEHNRTLLRGQELIVDLAPSLWVAGDADRLRQVVLNLLDNARKYTAAGGQITLRAHSRRSVSRPELTSTPAAQTPELEPQNRVVVEVEDNGVGIPADALAHLFDPFYRVDSARTRANGGSGLGLAIVKAIVQAHQGHIDIYSTPGAGTRVAIELPRLPTPPAQPAGDYAFLLAKAPVDSG